MKTGSFYHKESTRMKLRTKLFIVFVLIAMLATYLWMTSSNRRMNQLPKEKLKRKTPRQQENYAGSGPVDEYIYNARRCELQLTDPFEKLPVSIAFEEYWRQLPRIADMCGVNPQMGVQFYPSSSQLTLFYIPNMKHVETKEKCTALSYLNSKYRQQEENFVKSNSECSMQVLKQKPNLLVHLSNDSGPIHNLFIGENHSSHELLTLLFTHNQKTNVLGNVVCQVNLIYREPSLGKQHQFMADVNRIILDNRYLLIRAEKDFSGTHMNLFMVNYHEPYCKERYFKHYTFD